MENWYEQEISARKKQVEMPMTTLRRVDREICNTMIRLQAAN